MTKYVRVYETSDSTEANKLIKNGWDLISPSTEVTSDGEGTYVRYNLGLSYKEYTNKLLSVIKDYEKHGYKDKLLKKVEEELNDKIDNYGTKGWHVSDSPLANYLSNYEMIVNGKEVSYYDKNNHDNATMLGLGF